jgi:hypothetical protein
LPRSYQHSRCSVCGHRTTNNGMGRSAHEHSEVHIKALREKIAECTNGTQRDSLQNTLDELERDNKRRQERREAHLRSAHAEVAE